MRGAGGPPKSARRAQRREKREEWSDESRPRPAKVGEKGGRGNAACFCSAMPVLLGRADTRNLTQWREGAKGAKIRFIGLLFQIFYPAIPALSPVIPAKAGIQRVSAKFATGNQVQIVAGGSLLPLWEKARMRVRRAPARLCGRDARAPRPQTYPSKPTKGEGIRWMLFALDFG